MTHIHNFFEFFFVVSPVLLFPFTYPHSRFPFLSIPPRQSSPFWECDRSHSLLCWSYLHEGTGKLRKTCADTVGHLTGSVPSLQSLKNVLSSLICRPWTDGHPSKYWPSTKLFDLGDRLAPDTYHTPNVVDTEDVCIFFQTNIYWRNTKNVKNNVFLGFNLEDVISVNFYGHICNQQVKIRRYTKFQSDHRYLAFGSTPKF